jgi:hypothetical protein
MSTTTSDPATRLLDLAPSPIGPPAQEPESEKVATDQRAIS